MKVGHHQCIHRQSHSEPSSVAKLPPPPAPSHSSLNRRRKTPLDRAPGGEVRGDLSPLPPGMHNMYRTTLYNTTMSRTRGRENTSQLNQWLIQSSSFIALFLVYSAVGGAWAASEPEPQSSHCTGATVKHTIKTTHMEAKLKSAHAKCQHQTPVLWPRTLPS